MTVTLALEGGLTGEGIVDFDDLAVMVGEWLKPGSGACAGADLTGDGEVDVEDFPRLAGKPPAGRAVLACNVWRRAYNEAFQVDD